ncbi:hypothetical protein JAAARDRAFT_292750 [Jaapia argillacea MUCL 33604]|uniref:F-box domain-containing protein n=1 Tax=Jaapia argillacea MUCL 33604 TaxID=933084 RepID=A0A067Q1F9_9AGAM|nr:hypothetical protein JAAARDRAFT_292750 [Jaapia argillacea MUCL 33604]
MHLLDLNFDVLESIFQSLPNSSLRQISAASPVAFDLALPHLVAHVTLNRDSRQFHDFCRFILNPSISPSVTKDFVGHDIHRTPIPVRAGMLKSLALLPKAIKLSPTTSNTTFAFATLDYTLSSALATLLSHTTNLSSLTLTNAEFILITSPKLLTVIPASCSNLSKVQIIDGKGLAKSLLRRMKGLREVSVQLDGGEAGDLMEVFWESRGTLESLEVGTLEDACHTPSRGQGHNLVAGGWPIPTNLDGSIDPVSNNRLMRLTEGVSFPSLQHLKLSRFVLDTAILPLIFPNIQQLHLHDVRHFPQIPSDPFPSIVPRWDTCPSVSIQGDLPSINALSLASSFAIKSLHVDSVIKSPDVQNLLSLFRRLPFKSCHRLAITLDLPFISESAEHPPQDLSQKFWDDLAESIPRLRFTWLHPSSAGAQVVFSV